VAENWLRTTVIDEQPLIAKSTRPGPFHAIKKLNVIALTQEKAGYIGVLMQLCLSNTSNMLCITYLTVPSRSHLFHLKKLSFAFVIRCRIFL